MKFEEALEELESIIGKMESGSMPLDKSIEYFKRGTELIKYCDGILDGYEKMITSVTPGTEAEISEEEI